MFIRPLDSIISMLLSQSIDFAKACCPTRRFLVGSCSQKTCLAASMHLVKSRLISNSETTECIVEVLWENDFTANDRSEDVVDANLAPVFRVCEETIQSIENVTFDLCATQKRCVLHSNWRVDLFTLPIEIRIDRGSH